MTLVEKAGAVRDLRNRFTRPQELTCAVHSYDRLIFVRRDSDFFMKGSDEVIRTQADRVGERADRDILLRMGVQPILDSADCRVLPSRVAEAVARHKVVRDQTRHNSQYQRLVL